MKISEKQRLASISAVRELADFLESNPLVPIPAMNLNTFVDTKEKLVALAKSLGRIDKGEYEDWFYLRKHFSGGHYLDINIDRKKICERIVVGKKVIEEQFIPAHKEDIIEWKCSKSLLA